MPNHGNDGWQPTKDLRAGSPPAVKPAHQPHVFKAGMVRQLDPKEGVTELQLRDQFAMAALTGMLAHSTRYKPREEGVDWHWSIAKEAYELADAMMERRKP